jgi:anti-sigma factor RsiW
MAGGLTGPAAVAAAGVGTCCPATNGRAETRTLSIVWQRLVKEGETCARCGGTYAELQRAVRRLQEALRPLGIEPKLEAQEIDEARFTAAPSESNRIWIAGRPLEDWLGATIGSSRCCAACGDADCRTVELAGRSFETIPEDLIVRAALRAAAELGGPRSRPDAACCPPSNPAP